jgi:hypothetical protein
LKCREQFFSQRADILCSLCGARTPIFRRFFVLMLALLRDAEQWPHFQLDHVRLAITVLLLHMNCVNGAQVAMV